MRRGFQAAEADRAGVEACGLRAEGFQGTEPLAAVLHVSHQIRSAVECMRRHTRIPF